MPNLKALEAYLEVATLGSVTAAAQRLNMSQPSVSRLIRELERDLAQPLFERAGQRLTPTAQGMLLRDDVERALAGIADLWERARELSDAERPPLRVAAVSSLATGLLPHAWRALDPEGRGRLIATTDSPDRVRNAARSGAVDLGAGSLPLEHRDVAIRWLGAAPCVLAVPEDDPLARETGPVELRALRGRTVISMSHARGLPARLRRALGEAGVEAPGVLTNSTMNALTFVRAGLGVSVIEPVTLAGGGFPGVRTLPLAAPILYCFGAVVPAAGEPSDRAGALAAALEAEAAARLADFVTYAPEEHRDLLLRLSLLEDRR